jgi:hypothetical protein
MSWRSSTEQSFFFTGRLEPDQTEIEADFNDRNAYQREYMRLWRQRRKAV